VSSGLPRPNQVDDFRRLLEIGRACQRLAVEGHELLAAGNAKAARERLARGDKLIEERARIEARWKPPSMGTVENPEQAVPAKPRKPRTRR
jgi:hypothetical protein